MRITKAKIKNNLYLYYEYEEMIEDGTFKELKVDSDAPIHGDLTKTFRDLTPFFAHLCEEISDNKMKKFIKGELADDDDVYLKFKVNSFSIGGSDDNEGVTLSGQKFTEMGKSINFNSPFLKWDEDYEYSHEFHKTIETARIEVEEYNSGKRAPDPQTSMMFEEFEIEEVFEE